jgi:hypothetical protein
MDDLLGRVLSFAEAHSAVRAVVLTGSRARAVAPQLYSIPLFSVYNGKDVAVGKPSSEVGNAAACTVSLETVMRAARELLATRPVLLSSDAGAQ